MIRVCAALLLVSLSAGALLAPVQDDPPEHGASVRPIGEWIDDRVGAARIYTADQDLADLVVLAPPGTATLPQREGLAEALLARWEPDGPRWRLTRDGDPRGP